MFFIPLNQIESVELVIHALKAAGGEADCTTCPARRVCMKQCLTIADSVARMVERGALPVIEPDGAEPPETGPEPEPPAPGPAPREGHLKIIK